MKIDVLGKQILTGGEYGPEGGIIGIFSRLIVILLLWLLYKRKSKLPPKPRGSITEE